jgi:hypothetical protein
MPLESIELVDVVAAVAVERSLVAFVRGLAALMRQN